MPPNPSHAMGLVTLPGHKSSHIASQALFSSGKRGPQLPVYPVFVPQRILRGRTGPLKVIRSLLLSPAGSMISNRHIVGTFMCRESPFPTVLVHLRCTGHEGRQQPPTSYLRAMFCHSIFNLIALCVQLEHVYACLYLCMFGLGETHTIVLLCEIK